MANPSASHKLRLLAHKHLTESECSSLKSCIKQFRVSQSVFGLCVSLKTIIDSPDKACLLPIICQMMSPSMAQEFEKLCRIHFSCYHPKVSDVQHSGDSSSKFVISEDRRRLPDRVYMDISRVKHESSTKGTRSENQGHGISRESKLSKDDHYVGDMQRSERLNVKQPKQKIHKRSKTFHCTVTNSQEPSGSNYFQRQTSAKKELLQKFLNSSSESATGSDLLTKEDQVAGVVRVRKVTLSHKDGESLGFCIRGGKDLNAGIFISEIDPGGKADKKGLKVGERILKVNDVVFRDITHAQAVVTIKSSPCLVMYVAPLGQMPGGTPSAIPRNSDVSMGDASSQGCNKSNANITSPSKAEVEGELRKIIIMADEDGWLGFSIRGGTDYKMDVCIGNVDMLSPAENAGLKKGMIIEKINEVSVKGMEHMAIVQLVTQSRVVVLHIGEGMVTPRRLLPTVPPQRNQKPLVPEPPVSPIPDGYQDFMKELKSTPPIQTSTPLPPDDHPAIIRNKRNILNKLKRNTKTGRDATIIQIMKEVNKEVSNKQGKKKSQKKGAVCDIQSSDLSPIPESGSSKLDRETIRMNLASHSDKELFVDNKLLNFEESGERKGKIHVKDIFKTSGQSSGVSQPRPNILSTPVVSSKFSSNWIVGKNTMSPSSDELKEAKASVMRQLDQGLTGKHRSLLFTPNVPPSPHMRGVSKLLSQVRDLEGLGGDTESVDDNNGRISRQMSKAVSMRSSAYDMMSDSKLWSHEQSSKRDWTSII